jgi:hypothetical protein
MDQNQQPKSQDQKSELDETLERSQLPAPSSHLDPRTKNVDVKGLTNLAFFTRIMEFSRFGAMVQGFILEAVSAYCDGVLREPRAKDHGGGVVSKQLWWDIAQSLKAQIDEKYGDGPPVEEQRTTTSEGLAGIDAALFEDSPNGWVCWNDDFEDLFWTNDRQTIKRELFSNIRPATALEKVLLTQPVSTPALEEIDKWLHAKYVHRASERQKAMGLSYIEAESTDLARSFRRFIAERATL